MFVWSFDRLCSNAENLVMVRDRLTAAGVVFDSVN